MGIPERHQARAQAFEESYEGDRIKLLRDVFDPEAVKAMGEWMQQHGASLGGQAGARNVDPIWIQGDSGSANPLETNGIWRGGRESNPQLPA